MDPAWSTAIASGGLEPYGGQFFGDLPQPPGELHVVGSGDRLHTRRVTAVLDEPVRGELAPGVDPETVIDLIVGAVWYHVLVRQTPLSPDFAERIADLALAGLPRPS